MNDEEQYKEVKRIGRNNLGTIIRYPEWQEERVFFSLHNAPKQHSTLLEAALWVREDRPKGSSKYKTYIYRSLESGRGRSRVSDGTYCETYDEAIEWIEKKAQEFGGEEINWLDLEKTVVRFEQEEE